jgi:hypothetical protein
MVKEHDRVILVDDLPELGLEAGNIGVIIFVPKSGEGRTVEFVALDGSTVAVAPLRASQIRSVTADDFPHVRRIPAQTGERRQGLFPSSFFSAGIQ